MAEALHRFQNELQKGCMKSKHGPDCKTLQGSCMSWVADVHRLRFSETDWKIYNVMSVCCSTYCLSERRSMELCVFVELHLTACLDFSCLYMFHSVFAALL